MGLGDRVVGVSSYCRYPEEVRKLPQVGTFLKPDTERIAALRPDIVIVHGKGDIARQLGILHIPFVIVDRGTLANLYSTIRTIGDATAAPDRAAKLVAQIETRLAGVRRAVEGRAPRKVLLIVGRRPGTLTDLVAVGNGSYLSDIATLAGGVNVLGDPGLPEYPRISMETVIRLAPDVIIDAGDMGDTPETRRQRAEATKRLWSRTAVPAGREGRVHPVVSEAVTVPGPRVIEVAETFAEWIHGVRPMVAPRMEGHASAWPK